MRLPVYMNKGFADVDIRDIDFSTRTQNCLLRAGYKVMEDVVEAGDKLRSIKGMGQKSLIEIWSKIFEMQLEMMTDEEIHEYILDIAAANA